MFSGPNHPVRNERTLAMMALVNGFHMRQEVTRSSMAGQLVFENAHYINSVMMYILIGNLDRASASRLKQHLFMFLGFAMGVFYENSLAHNENNHCVSCTFKP